MTESHEHEFLGTYIRTMADGSEYVIYSGERDSDRVVQMCDCGEIDPEVPRESIAED